MFAWCLRGNPRGPAPCSEANTVITTSSQDNASQLQSPGRQTTPGSRGGRQNSACPSRHPGGEVQRGQSGGPATLSSLSHRWGQRPLGKEAVWGSLQCGPSAPITRGRKWGGVLNGTTEIQTSILLRVAILLSFHKLGFAKLSPQKAFILRPLPELGDAEQGLENDSSSEPPGCRPGQLLCAFVPYPALLLLFFYKSRILYYKNDSFPFLFSLMK